MSEYVVTSDALELDRGSFFTTLPVALERGDLALFDLAGFLLAGRWDPDPDGTGYILIPGYRIQISGEVPVRIVGLVILAESPPAEMGELTEEERAQALERVRRLK